MIVISWQFLFGPKPGLCIAEFNLFYFTNSNLNARLMGFEPETGSIIKDAIQCSWLPHDSTDWFFYSINGVNPHVLLIRCSQTELYK